jgi:glycosyltransferase involved in cell wall biosynthesis
MQAFDLVAPRAARFVDAVIAATEQEAAYFRRLGARRSEWIPPGVVPPEMGTRPNEIAAFCRRSGIEPGPVILVVGRDNSRKALPFGISVFRELRASWPDAQMLLVGPGERYVAPTQGLHCLGWLDRAELDLAFRAADALFVPSLYEGLPRVVIEGWSYSLPVVTTDRVALAPLVGRTGKAVVPYGDVTKAASALRAFLLDTDAAARTGAAGRAIVSEHFLLEDVVRRTAMLYAALARGA